VLLWFPIGGPLCSATVATPQQLIIYSRGQFMKGFDLSKLSNQVEIDFTLGPDHACSVVKTPSAPTPSACGNTE
jgi:hypothetical protein